MLFNIHWRNKRLRATQLKLATATAKPFHRSRFAKNAHRAKEANVAIALNAASAESVAKEAIAQSVVSANQESIVNASKLVHLEKVENSLLSNNLLSQE
jgi:hypothetical protein